MGSLSQRQQSHFTDRIRRIEQGGPNTSGTIYAGIDGAEHRRRRKKRERVSGKGMLGRLFMLPFSLALGAGLMLVGRIAVFHALADPELIPPERLELFRLTADIGIATVLALLLVPLFSVGHGLRLVLFMAGFVAVMLGESTIISKAPGPFTSMFSEDYVQTAIATAPKDPFSPEALGL